MCTPEERQQVVFAQAEERNIPNEHHIVAVVVEERSPDNRLGGDSVTVGEKAPGVGDPERSVDKTFAIRILDDGQKQLARQVLNVVAR